MQLSGIQTVALKTLRGVPSQFKNASRNPRKGFLLRQRQHHRKRRAFAHCAVHRDAPTVGEASLHLHPLRGRSAVCVADWHWDANPTIPAASFKNAHNPYLAIGSTTVNVMPSPTVLCGEMR